MPLTYLRFPAATRSFIRCEGRKVSTRRGWIGTSSPVFGLRPTRAVFSRTLNVPKEDIFTCSPRTSASDIWFSMLSTSCALSLRERPTSRKTASLKSIRVRVLSLIGTPVLFCEHRVRGKSLSISMNCKAQVRPLPAQYYGTPSKTAADCLGHDQITPLDLAALLAHRQGQRDGSGRSVAVILNRDHHLLHR